MQGEGSIQLIFRWQVLESIHVLVMCPADETKGLDVIQANETVHDYEPFYTFFKKNCFWFSNLVFDTCLEVTPCQLDFATTREDNTWKCLFDPYEAPNNQS